MDILIYNKNEKGDKKMIGEMIENQVIFAAKKGQGEIIEAPYRKFTPSPDLLKHYLKNLIGVPYGQPEVISGQVVAGSPLELSFPVDTQPGIGIRIQVSIPRDKPLSVFEAKYYFAVPGFSGASYREIATKIKPNIHDTANFIFLASFDTQTEVFPLTAQAAPNPVPPPDNFTMDLHVPADSAPDGTSITVYNLNLSDRELRDYVQSLG